MRAKEKLLTVHLKVVVGAAAEATHTSGWLYWRGEAANPCPLNAAEIKRYFHSLIV